VSVARRIAHRALRRAWHRLPEPVKQQVRRARGVTPAAVSHVMPPSAPPARQRVVRTLDELDTELKELDRLGAISDDALREGFVQFRMELDIDVPSDPFSPEYQAKVFELYEFLHGSPYEPSNEVSAIDIEAAVRSPFPYMSRSAVTVGNHLIGIGHVIRTLDLPPGSRILELGPGWGNTTLALAQMGHQVTAIDIEQNFVSLIGERAARVGVDIDVRQGDFSLIHELDTQFEAVLFFECFHHAANHLDVLASLDRVVAPGGRVVFGAEPIVESFPYPWGLRMDGESLWAIRQQGWFELGFKQSYFERALARYGWSAKKFECSETPWGMAFVATRLVEPGSGGSAPTVS
jgi:ubiquinone/menaquinone biosynthesis C-methylase UbiE